MSDLTDRIEALEKRILALDDLPLAPLKRFLENNWQPEANQALLPGSVGPTSLANIPACLVSTSTDQADGGVPTNVYYDDAEPTNNLTYDKANMHTPGAATPGEKMVAPVQGIYICTALILYTDQAAARSALVRIQHQPSGVSFAQTNDDWAAGVQKVHTAVGAFFFNAGDHARVQFQTSAPATCKVDSSFASMTWVGPYR